MHKKGKSINMKNKINKCFLNFYLKLSIVLFMNSDLPVAGCMLAIYSETAAASGLIGHASHFLQSLVMVFLVIKFCMA